MFKNMKKFVKENKKEVIATCVVGGSAIIGVLLVNKIYKKGFIDGGFVGFTVAQEWFDKNCGTNLQELWLEYKKSNPDKIIERIIKL